MHPCHHAKTHPDKAAYIMAASGETVTFKQLDERSNQIAHAFRDAGLKPGDTIALFAENSPRYFEVCWAAQRSGLYFVCVSSRLTAPEVKYILEDSGSSLLIASASKSLDNIGRVLHVNSLSWRTPSTANSTTERSAAKA